jgi:hypothetical protein
MSKETPINQLPNVEMRKQLIDEQPVPQQQMPPPMGQQMPPPQMGQQMPLQMGQQMPPPMGQQMPQPVQSRQDSNFMQRQFVPQQQGNVPYNNQQAQMLPEQVPVQNNQQLVVEPPKSSGILQELMDDSKPLAFVFVLLLFVQLETTQGLFRRIARLFNVGDSLLFTVSKIIAALVGVVVFFFLTKNL